MSNVFFRIIAPDLDEDGAQRAARDVARHLVSRGYVSEAPVRYLPTSLPRYLPGPRYAELYMERPAKYGAAFGGVEITATRDPRFYENGQEGFTVSCPFCHQQAVGLLWQKAMTSYHYGSSGILLCHVCRKLERIDRWTYEPNVGFSRLCISFWNAPHLREDRLHELTEVVDSPVKVIYGAY